MEAKFSPSDRLYRLFDDAWNPVLVKDIRQALRGRLFTYGFIIALTLAGLATAIWATSGSDPDGRLLFGWLLAGLSVFNFLFIPLATFQSLASEAEAGRLDHLSLTRMGAVGIVTGKLSAALVQVGLCIMAFAPFMLMCGLARGIDSVTILHGILRQLSMALFLASAALAMALMARGTFGRLAWQAALIALMVFMSGFRFLLVSPAFFLQHPSLRGVASNVCLSVGFAVFFVTVAVVRVQSGAENRSSTLRFGISIAIALEAAGLFLDPSSVMYVRQGLLAMVLLALPALVLVTESPDLTPSQRRWIRKHPRVPAMYAPGRDTAVLFLCVHLFLILVAAVGPYSLFGPGSFRFADGGGALLALPAVLCVYGLLPSSILWRMSRSPSGRTRLRFVIVCLIPFTIFVPPLIVFFLGGHTNGVNHPLNPVYVVGKVFWDGEHGATLSIWLTLSALALAVALWRMRNGVALVRAVRRSSPD